MKTSSIAVETSRSTTQSDSIVRQTNKRSSYLSYTTMINKKIFNDIHNSTFPEWIETILASMESLELIVLSYSIRVARAMRNLG